MILLAVPRARVRTVRYGCLVETPEEGFFGSGKLAFQPATGGQDAIASIGSETFHECLPGFQYPDNLAQGDFLRRTAETDAAAAAALRLDHAGIREGAQNLRQVVSRNLQFARQFLGGDLSLRLRC